MLFYELFIMSMNNYEHFLKITKYRTVKYNIR